MSAENLQIIVGEGTCGRASGSAEILSLFQTNAPEAKIDTVGCVGMCHAEVMVEVRGGDGSSHMYGNVDKKGVTKILKYHRGEGDMPEDLLLTSSNDPEREGGQYLTRQTRLALRNVGHIDATNMAQYEARGGYTAIKKILGEGGMTPEQVIAEVKASGIRGRGGAGFPTAIKWNFARQAEGDQKYFICNGDEGDPGAFMDRSLLEGDPHNILEGMLIGAYAVGASGGYAYIRAEYPLAVKNFGIAIEDAMAAGYLGDNILGSGFSLHVKIKQGAGAFVCGEETALIASVEGERGMPRIRPPFPAVKGLFGKPWWSSLFRHRYR